MFVNVVGSILVLQVILVTFSGRAFFCYIQVNTIIQYNSPVGGLNAQQWIICLCFGATSIIMNFILKFISEDNLPLVFTDNLVWEK